MKSSAKSPPRFPAFPSSSNGGRRWARLQALFPAYGEADWRRAAEAALNGASFERLVSKTADGILIEPVYRPAEGPRALRTRRAMAR